MPRSLTINDFSGQGIDVSEPVVYISLVSATTGRNMASLAEDSPNGEDTSLSDRVISLKVTTSAKRAASCELTLWNEDLALLDTPVMQKGTQLKIAWGYSGYMGKKHTFKVQKVKGSTARVANFGQLKIVALSQTFDLHGKAKSKTYRNMSKVQVAEKIAKGYGLTGNKVVLGPDDKKKETINQVNQTDAQFLLSMAQRLGWDFKLEEGIFQFKPSQDQKDTGPIASYTYFSDEEGWIKRFEPEISIMSVAGSVTVKSRDPITGRKVKFTQTIQNSEEKSLGRYIEVLPGDESIGFSEGVESVVHRSQSPIKAGVTPTNQVIHSPSSNSRQVKNEAKVRHKNSLSQGVKSRMVIIGDPDIWSGVTVAVDGVGKMMSGLHTVIKAVHMIDSKGYEIDCKLRRQGIGTLGKHKKPAKSQKAKAQKVSRKLKERVGGTAKAANKNTTGVVKKTSFKRT